MEVGIDVGGTKTQVVVADGGDPVADFTVPTRQWRKGPQFSDPLNPRRLLGQLPPGLVGRTDVPIAAGVHGCDSGAQCEALQGMLRSVHPGPVLVVNDSELFGPAVGLTEAINVVSGTGSIVVGRTAAGNLVKVGGFGWLLGDPGSAPGLVRESVKAILAAHDAGAAPGRLAQALMNHYGSPDPVQMGYDFTADVEITHWGALSPLVFDAAEQGDGIATDVIGRHGAQLAADVRTIRQRGAVGSDVVLAGGVVSSQPAMAAAFTERLTTLEPSLTVTVLHTPPVLGALALARGLKESQIQMTVATKE
jgi:N-acetylglucosamine kinase-like BadF-type ATPase